MVPEKETRMLRRSVLRYGLAALAALAAAGCQMAAPQYRTALYDTHAHFFTNDFTRYPPAGGGLYTGAEAIRARVTADPKTPENTLPLWDANGIAGGAGVQYFTVYGADNSYLVDSSDAHPGRIAAVVILDARDASAPAEIKRLVEQHGVTGLRITGFADEDGGFGWLDSAAALATWAEADRLGIAMVVMLGRTQDPTEGATRIAALAQRFARVNIVLDHVGQPTAAGPPDFGVSPAFAALARRSNIYYKFTTFNMERLAAADIPANAFLRHVVDVFGAEHVMWGSDFGNSQGTLSDLVARAVEAASLLSAAERRAVLHDTGWRIFARRCSAPREGCGK